MALKDYDIKKIYDWPLKSQLYFLISLGIIFSVAYLTYAYLNYNKMKQFYITSETNILNEYRTNLQNQANVNANIQEFVQLKSQINQFLQQFVPHNQINEIIDTIFKKGQDKGLRLSAFEMEPTTKNEEIPFSSIKLDAIGDYDQLSAFLSDIANMNKLVVINDFSFIQANPENKMNFSILKSAATKATLNLRIYEKNDKQV